MLETESTRSQWFRLSRSLSAKLNLLLLGAMVLIFALLGYFNVRLHRQHLEQNTLHAAERTSDVIRSFTIHYMLKNDREGLYRSIQTMAAQPEMEKIRIFDRDGRIIYTTDAAEQDQVVDKKAEACYACHAQSQPLAKLNRPDRFRIYRNAAGERVLGIITPLENQPACSNAACHAHPAEQQVLGVLDTNVSLAKADVQLAESTRGLVIYATCALLLVAGLCGMLIWRVVGRPVKALQSGTEHLAAGELGYQIAVRSDDEIGDLARSFNDMSRRLESEHKQNLAWTHTLEEAVTQKTSELKAAHEHALRTEKMASIGKMAAVLAHEINNPLSGILTYAKLVRKWAGQDDGGVSHRKDVFDSLDLIASESRRCGELVKSLLAFSRTTPMNLQPARLNQVVEQSVRLLRHQLDMAGIHLQKELDPQMPPVICDAAQIEQVVITLMTNALDAMPQGGNLWITTQLDRQAGNVRLVVRDDGSGIPADILPRIFEPFLTTKETGRGVGLGLAVAHSILDRHNGTIAVESEAGRGSTFTVTLPWEGGSEPIVGPTDGEVLTGAGR
jgi:two-component system NtrC family sensor kinase